VQVSPKYLLDAAPEKFMLLFIQLTKVAKNATIDTILAQYGPSGSETDNLWHKTDEDFIQVMRFKSLCQTKK